MTIKLLDDSRYITERGKSSDQHDQHGYKKHRPAVDMSNVGCCLTLATNIQ